MENDNVNRVLVVKALSKANQAQIKSKEATRKVEQAKKELEDIAAILATVQEPGACAIFSLTHCALRRLT